VITYDLSEFPSFVADQRTHAYRPIVIKDGLMRARSVLFLENSMRVRGGSAQLRSLQSIVMNPGVGKSAVKSAGVLGWNTATAVSSLTHPKMFDYFESKAEEFNFLRMVDLDAVFFSDSSLVAEKIMLPWLKCCLTLECIDPIGESGGMGGGGGGGVIGICKTVIRNVPQSLPDANINQSNVRSNLQPPSSPSGLGSCTNNCHLHGIPLMALTSGKFM